MEMALTVPSFCAGVVSAANSITGGLCAMGSERGKGLGLLALTSGVGPLLGSELAGPIAAVEQQRAVA